MRRKLRRESRASCPLGNSKKPTDEELNAMAMKKAAKKTKKTAMAGPK